MFAIVRTGGKQYKVTKDATLTVEKLEAEIGDTVELEVLMTGDDKGAKLGDAVKGAKVTAEIVDQNRDKKVIIFKKKRRHNYRRKKGHRQYQSVIKITDIKVA